MLVHEIEKADRLFSWTNERIRQDGKFAFRVIFCSTFEQNERMDYA